MELPPLPESSDEDYWAEAEKYTHEAVPIEICETHKAENWMSHDGYEYERVNSTISCIHCPWSSRVPGYFRVKDGIVWDLRDASS